MLVRIANTILTKPEVFWPKESAISVKKLNAIILLKASFSFKIISHLA